MTLRQCVLKGIELGALSEKDLEAVNIDLAKKDASPHTVKTVRDILKVFLKFRGNHNLAASNELKSGNPYRNPEYKLKFADLLTPQEVGKLIKFSNPKLAAALALLYGSGCRVGGLKTLKRQDCIWTEDNHLTINIVSKGSVNTIWVRPDLAMIVRKWFNASPYGSETDFVFPNPHGQRLSNQTIIQGLKKVAIKAGITKRVYPHLFRHTHFSELLNAGMPNNFIKSRGWNNQTSRQLDMVYGPLD